MASFISYQTKNRIRYCKTYYMITTWGKWKNMSNDCSEATVDIWKKFTKNTQRNIRGEHPFSGVQYREIIVGNSLRESPVPLKIDRIQIGLQKVVFRSFETVFVFKNKFSIRFKMIFRGFSWLSKEKNVSKKHKFSKKNPLLNIDFFRFPRKKVHPLVIPSNRDCWKRTNEWERWWTNEHRVHWTRIYTKNN